MLTQTGQREMIAALVVRAPRHIAWGTSSTAPAETNTTLGAEAPEARVVGAISTITTAHTGDTYQVVGTMTATAARTIAEAGLFDALTAGNMYVRGVHAGEAMAANDKIEYTFRIQQRRGV